MSEKIEYTAVVRTLGTAGEKYLKLLKSLVLQTIKPKGIIVYIAEGHSIPKETVGFERYVYVKKGMVAQRALSYDEIETEYMLCLDDDLEFPPNTVECMFKLLIRYDADVISPDIFPNAKRPFKSEIMMMLSGRMLARRNDNVWGYKVMRTAGYSYNKNQKEEVYLSQTNAGACFLCRKTDFLKIRFEEELWMDSMSYALGDDQVMFYKMYCCGLKQLTWYNHQFVHLDAGGNMTPEKEQKRLYGDIFFKNVFWHRFIYFPEKTCILKFWDVLCIIYYLVFTLSISLLKCNFKILATKWKAISDAKKFISSEQYKVLPPIVKLQ